MVWRIANLTLATIVYFDMNDIKRERMRGKFKEEGNLKFGNICHSGCNSILLHVLNNLDAKLSMIDSKRVLKSFVSV